MRNRIASRINRSLEQEVIYGSATSYWRCHVKAFTIEMDDDTYNYLEFLERT